MSVQREGSGTLTRGHSSLCYSGAMPRRTYESDGRHIESADDLDGFVSDKRVGWRATPAKARRRQRRYGKRLTKTLVQDGLAAELD